MIDRITLRRPDDWHVHLRDGEMLAAVVPYTARQFARAIVMPNLSPPVTTVEAARAYRARIVAAVPAGVDFMPLMTAYLTDTTDADALVRGHEEGVFTAAKLYPAHATTNSAHGVTDVGRLGNVFDAMARCGMPLLVHGEVTDPNIDVFDREAVFIDRVLQPLTVAHPTLKIVVEHITTAQAVDFVTGSGHNVAATITPHHLHLDRNAMFDGGIRPHTYCLPIVKRAHHRDALRAAAVSGSRQFFLGTDSAPHTVTAKESACGCAGIFNAPFALESYAAIFDAHNALDRLEGFASRFGPEFYGLPLNEARVTLVRASVPVPALVDGIVPFHASETIGWRVEPA